MKRYQDKIERHARLVACRLTYFNRIVELSNRWTSRRSLWLTSGFSCPQSWFCHAFLGSFPAFLPRSHALPVACLICFVSATQSYFIPGCLFGKKLYSLFRKSLAIDHKIILVLIHAVVLFLVCIYAYRPQMDDWMSIGTTA